MRLKALEISGFRGFAVAQSFDLDGDAIVVVGANGNGKTSLFDAILWAICGRIPRLSEKDAHLVCRFSETGQARVVLTLHEADHGDLSITRSFDGERTSVRVQSWRGIFSGPQAEGEIIELIWRDAATSAQPGEALAAVLTRCVYLQQDLVRHFIESETDQQKFLAVSELVGAGRVTELQTELERQKAAWTRATNTLAGELQPLRARLSSMEARITELKGRPALPDDASSDSAWDAWWTQLEALGVRVNRVAMDSRDAPAAIDSAIKGLDATRRAAERRQQLLTSLMADLKALSSAPRPDARPLREEVLQLGQRMDSLRTGVAEEQSRVAEVRRLQSELTERNAQLRTLAGLALQHLGERCPVCQQTYDIDATRRRLQSLVSPEAGIDDVTIPDRLPALLADLAAAEVALAEAQVRLRSTEQLLIQRESAERQMEERFADLGASVTAAEDRSVALGHLAVELGGQIEQIGSVQRTGEALALRLARAAEVASLRELETESLELRARVHEGDEGLRRRGTVGNQAQEIIEALREAASETVTEQVRQIEPLLAEIYSRIDVHPAFRAVSFLADVVRGRGRLSTVVSDPLSSVNCDRPNLVLSSSQMNALAVCTFLSLNLGIATPPIAAAILDDPLQSLDDINLLGLVDLLRRTKDSRQLCVSTHDIRFGALLARKLRPRNASQRTVVIEIDGWTRSGPSVSVRDVAPDPVELRLVG